MIKKILRKMMEGSVDINEIAQELDLSRGTLEAILEMAIREGYVEKAGTASGCGGCPLSSKCGAEPSRHDGKIYVLTLKGEEYAGSRSKLFRD